VIGVDHCLNNGARLGVVHVKECSEIFGHSSATSTAAVALLVTNLAAGLANKYIK
jgi:hypothetical protein